jgi:hypothetical protein
MNFSHPFLSAARHLSSNNPYWNNQQTSCPSGIKNATQLNKKLTHIPFRIEFRRFAPSKQNRSTSPLSPVEDVQHLMTALVSSNHNITISNPPGKRSFDHTMVNFPPPHEIESFFNATLLFYKVFSHF